jgi:hypothetical protein
MNANIRQYNKKLKEKNDQIDNLIEDSYDDTFGK